MQPMDVAFFAALKKVYKDCLNKWRSEHSGKVLTKVYFPSVLKQAISSLDLISILQNGFKRCGLYSFSDNPIKYDKLLTSYRINRISSTSRK